MKRDDFVGASTTVKILESKMLSSAQVNRMVEAKDLAEAIKVLNETAYQDTFSKLERPEDYEKALAQESKKLYRTIRDLSPVKGLVDIALQKYDAHNLKILIKDNIYGTNTKNLLVNLGSIDKLEATNISSELKLDRWIEGADELVKKTEGYKDAQPIEIEIDKFILKRTLEIAQKLGEDFFVSYAKNQIDFSNLLAVFRMKRQKKDLSEVDKVMVEGGNIDPQTIKDVYNDNIESIVERFSNTKIGSHLKKALTIFNQNHRLSEFEKMMDNYQVDLVKDSKYITYGPEVLFSYLITKEIELKNIRIILVSKLNNLEPDKIRERLRD